MGTSENFCLRWNDFEANVSDAFRDLRADDDFFDVTLACCDDVEDDEARFLKAHKVVLAAASELFRSMLRTLSGERRPTLFLRGVKFADLERVLDFVYHGEVNVAQNELNAFLAVAEDLRIKGLVENKRKPTTPKAPRPVVLEQEHQPSVKRAKLDVKREELPSTSSQHDDDLQGASLITKFLCMG